MVLSLVDCIKVYDAATKNLLMRIYYVILLWKVLDKMKIFQYSATEGRSKGHILKVPR